MRVRSQRSRRPQMGHVLPDRLLLTCAHCSVLTTLCSPPFQALCLPRSTRTSKGPISLCPAATRCLQGRGQGLLIVGGMPLGPICTHLCTPTSAHPHPHTLRRHGAGSCGATGSQTA